VSKFAFIFLLFLSSCVEPRVGLDEPVDSTHAEKMGWVQSQDPAASKMLTGGTGTE